MVIALGPTVFNRDVSANDEAHRTKTLVEGGHDESQVTLCETTEEPDYWWHDLLRTRDGRPRHCAADKRDEMPSPHGSTLYRGSLPLGAALCSTAILQGRCR